MPAVGLAQGIDNHWGIFKGFNATTLYKAFFLAAIISGLSTGLAIELRLRVGKQFQQDDIVSLLVSIAIAFFTMLGALWVLWWLLGFGRGMLLCKCH
uniref:Uncharacterized protein n=1 Tax=Pithovirus LCPAC404 TaxID=2506597 RepID=A0A481ZDZ0_9VIRU|nr:MAG: hypothetical protein LCPAC404_03590 [Pithovirus LCPAC404]